VNAAQCKNRSRLIYQHPEGISSGDLTRELKDISAQSIQNALTALRKNNQIAKDGARGGKFRAITLEPTPPSKKRKPPSGAFSWPHGQLDRKK
jgi:hypothetical protein